MDNDTDDVYETKRFYEIDFLKGIATIFMVIFHFFYLMYHMNIANYNVRNGILYSLAKVAHVIFIFIVGVNLAISYKKFKRKNKELYKENKSEYNSLYAGRQLKRVFYLLIAGGVMSLLSYLSFGDLFVKFGIFHFIAISILFSIPVVKSKFLPLAISIISGLLYSITHSNRIKLYSSVACKNAPLFCFISGIYNVKFSSLDHFSIIPFYGLVTFGIFVGNMLYNSSNRKFLNNKKSREFDENFENDNLAKNMSLLGKYSFEIYFVHFVVFYLMLLAYKKTAIKMTEYYNNQSRNITSEIQKVQLNSFNN